MRVAVGVLQALAGQRRAAGGRADDEAARHLVAGRPLGVAGALEAEHRVEDVDRDERLAVRRVRRAGRGERRDGAGLVDADVHDLALRALLVGEEQLAVDRRVVLAVRVVDLRRREVRVHAERARLVGDDRHDAVTEVLRAQQVLQQADERHRGGDLLRARALLGQRVRVVARQREARRGASGAPAGSRRARDDARACTGSSRPARPGCSTAAGTGSLRAARPRSGCASSRGSA